MKVAINGAGIAGTALAYWLGRQGHEVLLVENAPELRVGGFVLNLWGADRLPTQTGVRLN
jgi:2-polyprenyl-6-methoxyphenol hydroxylase-like FAD-dependent oxidoreductase